LYPRPALPCHPYELFTYSVACQAREQTDQTRGVDSIICPSAVPVISIPLALWWILVQTLLKLRLRLQHIFIAESLTLPFLGLLYPFFLPPFIGLKNNPNNNPDDYGERNPFISRSPLSERQDIRNADSAQNYHQPG
jgi:hypothetical protein